MDDSPRLFLPYLAPSQAQKHVTVNEALRRLDALVQLTALSASTTVEPASPAEGDIYILPAAPTGDAWGAMAENSIAAFQDGAWTEIAPGAGWRAYILDASALAVFDGAAWSAVSAGGAGGEASFDTLGVNAEGDATNKLAVKSDAALFNHDDATPGTGDMRIVCNKAASSNTASFLFQNAFSGRAEFGLAGDDDFHLKVSPDGAAWTSAILVDKATGRVLLPAGLALADADQIVAARHVREKLSADRTYYVRADGDDGNDGLTNSAGGAFETIQHAVDVVSALDLSIYTATIQLASGTYDEAVTLAAPLAGGAGACLLGDAATPAHVVIDASATKTAGNATIEAFVGGWTVKGVTVKSTSGFAQNGLRANGCALTIEDCAIGAGFSGKCIQAESMARITLAGAIDFSGAHGYGMYAAGGSQIFKGSADTIACSGSPSFSGQFAAADFVSNVRLFGASSITGAATGQKFSVANNSALYYAGGAASLPGSSAGAAASGGQAS